MKWFVLILLGLAILLMLAAGLFLLLRGDQDNGWGLVIAAMSSGVGYAIFVLLLL